MIRCGGSYDVDGIDHCVLPMVGIYFNKSGFCIAGSV